MLIVRMLFRHTCHLSDVKAIFIIIGTEGECDIQFLIPWEYDFISYQAPFISKDYLSMVALPFVYGHPYCMSLLFADYIPMWREFRKFFQQLHQNMHRMWHSKRGWIWIHCAGNLVQRHSMVVCSRCDNVSNRYENMMDLTMALYTIWIADLLHLASLNGRYPLGR
ncbi:uncharacterized protein LOC116263224 isoform X2 [Nymphaea colorata]|uniref:uncharacterized protein LOC116263224 isoform X2 n=1 Tax=Nymphaea colorata TaxID=210225 RepID=UPI00214F20EE|nr:uncharacterized protein LOC116263224 isoform X2 [Nymphaea colorata]